MSLASYYENLIRSNTNLRKFLDVIGWAEGATYNVGFGNRKFYDLSWHPYRNRQFRIIDPVTGRSSTTSAAGKYQFQRGTWDNVARQLGLRDFSPRSQDIAAVHLIATNGQLANVLRGNISQAVQGLKDEWQSFVTRPLRSILEKFGYGSFDEPSSEIGAVTVRNKPVFDKNVKVIGEKNRYLIAFFILVIIFIFAFA